jgi:hypothetical protein
MRQRRANRLWSKPVGLGLGPVLVFLNAYRNNPQVHGITIIAFHLKVFKVSYFHRELMCKSLLASLPKITRRKIARVVRFSKDRDPKSR